MRDQKEFRTTAGSPAVGVFRLAPAPHRPAQRVIDLSDAVLVRKGVGYGGWGESSAVFVNDVLYEPPCLSPEGFRWTLVDSLPRPNLRIVSPFHVCAEETPEGAVVWHGATSVFGHGPTLSAALVDFGEALAQLYEELQADRATLGPSLQELARLLDSKIRSN